MGGSRSAPDALKELDSPARLRVRMAGLAAAIFALVTAAVFGTGARQWLFDLYQNALPAPDLSRQVHVVVLDAESLREVGGWPWSRFYLARLTEEIAGRGARAIGFDMLFIEPDRFDPHQFAGLYPELSSREAEDIRKLPSMDAVFARVIGRSPVVLAHAGVRPGSFDSLDHAADPPAPTTPFVGETPRRPIEFATIAANLPILDDSALGHGLVNGDNDHDGVIRRVPMVARAAGQLSPGFALELVRVAEGARQVELVGRRGRLEAVRVGARRIPVTSDGQLQPRFGDWRRTQVTSAVNLLRQGLPKDLFRNQIVLVGLTSAGASDLASTPRAEAVPGVFVQAQAVDSILRGIGLHRPAWAGAAEWALGLLLALVAFLATPRLPLRAVVAIGGAAVVAAFAASAAAFQQGILVDPFRIAAPGAATTAAIVALLFVEGRRAQARLRAELEDERRRADEHQQLLINELNHRVKNTLATVQSMAGQSFRAGRTPAEAQEAFVSRLIALSSAQNLLTSEGWESADLVDVVRMATAPFEDQPGARFTITGRPVRLEAQPALAIAMALHELAVNAVKFGALSAPGGRIQIAWRTTDDGEVRFTWEESGGPPVEPPVRKGFGTRLIQDGLARELGGRVRIEHAPSGLRCEIAFPLPPAQPSSGFRGREPRAARRDDPRSNGGSPPHGGWPAH